MLGDLRSSGASRWRENPLHVLGVHNENVASDAQAMGCVGVLYSQDARSFVSDWVIPLHALDGCFST